MKRRGGLAVAILLVWAAALGWLAEREYGGPRADRLAEAGLSVPPGATFYRVALGDEQVGFASSTVDTLLDTVRVRDVMVLEVPVPGRIHRTDARTDVVLSRALQMHRFSGSLRGDGTRFEASGDVGPDSNLRIDIASGDARYTLQVAQAGALMLPSVVPLSLAFGRRLGPGLRYAFRVFDPILLDERVVDVAIGAESTFVVPDSARFDSTAGLWRPARFDTVRAWRVAQRGAGPDLTVWIDEMGRVVEAGSATGFRMERAAFELAFENFRRRDTMAAMAAAARSAVVAATAIAAHVRGNAVSLELLRVRLGGVELGGLDLAGGRQWVSADTVTIDAREQTQPRLSSGGPRLGTFVRPEPLVQSDDPRIAAMARQIGGRRHVDIPRRINAWVFANLRKEATSSLPGAVAVLETRRGDANEHTVLSVALARALGIPARPVAGLLYVGGRFYYHSWPEYYLSGTWIAADPTFGQFPADASHVRLMQGALARPIELVRALGRLTVTVVEARNRP